MNNLIEENVGPELKQMARHYADGEFNKGQYRERRRHLLQTFLGEPIVDYDDEEDELLDDELTQWEVAAQRDKKQKRWLQLAGFASIALLGVMVLLISYNL